jgi:hypothetical protein
METTLNFRADEGLLYVTYSGDFSLAEAKKIFLQTIEAVEKYKARKVLVDGRTITGEVRHMDRYFYGEFVAAEVNKLRVRSDSPLPQFAYVLLPPVLDPRRFGETVAVNRGMPVKTFDNLDDALEWIGINPDWQ